MKTGNFTLETTFNDRHVRLSAAAAAGGIGTSYFPFSTIFITLITFKQSVAAAPVL